MTDTCTPALVVPCRVGFVDGLVLGGVLGGGGERACVAVVLVLLQFAQLSALLARVWHAILMPLCFRSLLAVPGRLRPGVPRHVAWRQGSDQRCVVERQRRCCKALQGDVQVLHGCYQDGCDTQAATRAPCPAVVATHVNAGDTYDLTREPLLRWAAARDVGGLQGWLRRWGVGVDEHPCIGVFHEHVAAESDACS